MGRHLVNADNSRSVDLEELYRDHFIDLVRVAFLLSGSAAAAEDAVHEVFVRCAPRLADIDHPVSYMRAAVVNECRTQHRRSSRQAAVEVTGGDEMPHELLETRDALATLSPRKRAAVVLRYFVDIPDEEIARILGCRPATVRSLVYRALKELREVLE